MAVRKILYATFLVALIAFKVSAMAIHFHFHHEHDHEEHQETCELCEHALEFINTAFSPTVATPLVEVGFPVNFNLPKTGYNSVCIVAGTDSTLFGRPPPVLL
ncbi:MAG: hypothetical protein AAF717_17995 [Bacteroidota bacterium]